MFRKRSKLIEPLRQNQWLGMALITFALTGVAGAQTTCPPPDLQPLQQPPEIDAQGGVLSTTFVRCRSTLVCRCSTAPNGPRNP